MLNLVACSRLDLSIKMPPNWCRPIPPSFWQTMIGGIYLFIYLKEIKNIGVLAAMWMWAHSPQMSGNIHFWNLFQRFGYPQLFHLVGRLLFLRLYGGPMLTMTYSLSLEWCDVNIACISIAFGDSYIIVWNFTPFWGIIIDTWWHFELKFKMDK